jgi:hypothetical protein
MTTVVNNNFWKNKAHIIKFGSSNFSGIFANTTHRGENIRSLIVTDMTTLKLIITTVTLPTTLIMCY